jgi:biotin synthase
VRLKDAQLRRTYGTVAEDPNYPSLRDALSTSSSTAPKRSVFQEAVNATSPRTNWTRDEIKEIYDTPLMELAFAAVSLLCLRILTLSTSLKSFG